MEEYKRRGKNERQTREVTIKEQGSSTFMKEARKQH